MKPNENRCETCVHWHPPSNVPRHLDLSPAGRQKGLPELGACERIRHERKTTYPTNAIAYLEDADEWDAVLRTSALFGCAMWKLR